jgi:hypothetical protein
MSGRIVPTAAFCSQCGSPCDKNFCAQCGKDLGATATVDTAIAVEAPAAVAGSPATDVQGYFDTAAAEALVAALAASPATIQPDPGLIQSVSNEAEEVEVPMTTEQFRMFLVKLLPCFVWAICSFVIVISSWGQPDVPLVHDFDGDRFMWGYPSGIAPSYNDKLRVAPLTDASLLEMEATSESAMLLACVRASAGVLDPVAMCASLLVINVIGLATFVAKKQKAPSAAFGFYKLLAVNFAPFAFMIIALAFVNDDVCAWHPTDFTNHNWRSEEVTSFSDEDQVDMWSAQIIQLSFANVILLGLPFLAKVITDICKTPGHGGSGRDRRRRGRRGGRRR